MGAWQKIKHWWDGEYIPPDQHSYVVSAGWQKYPLIRMTFEKIANFCLKEWKFLTGSLLTVAGLIIACLGIK